jgi:Flp pilus assembly protein TadG
MSLTTPARACSRALPRNRRGSVVLLCAFFLVVLMAMVGFAVDVGYLNLARTQLQRTADAAALAAAAELLDDDLLRGLPDLSDNMAAARQKAIEYAALNPVTGAAPQLDPNTSNDPDGDVVFGRLYDPSDLSEPLSFLQPDTYNTVLVRVRRTSVRNGAVPLFFARVLGFNEVDEQAEAAATLDDRVIGFRVTPNTGNAGLLPIAADISAWSTVLAGVGPDNWSYDSSSGTVSAGPDGIPELVLFPDSGNGNGNGQGNGGSGGIVPGNFGTVDVGSPNNSTAVLEQQILNGISDQDLQWYGGSLDIDPATGHLPLNGDTGVSAGIQDAVQSIVGQPRSIPLYDQVAGQGNGATFYVVGFAGVRVVDVDLTGALANKHITIQPALVVDDAAKTGTGPQQSTFIYQPVHLTR